MSYSLSHAKPQQYNFFNADYDKINEYLGNIDWTYTLCGSPDHDIDTAYQRFIEVLKVGIAKHVPLKKKRSKPRIPKHIKSMLHLKQNKYKQLKLKRISKEDYSTIQKAYKEAVLANNLKNEKNIALTKNKNLLYKYMNQSV